MDLSVFNQLPLDTQINLALTDGIFLLNRQTPELTVQLFALHLFYVELFTFQPTGKILMVKSFKNIERLNPYLKEIDITEIF